MMWVTWLSCAPPPEGGPPPAPPPLETADSGTPEPPPDSAEETGDTGTPPLPLPCGTLQSVVLVGGTEASTQSLASSSSGDLWAGGYFAGTLATMTAAGPSDGLILHYAPDGSLAWGRQVTASESAWSEALAPTAEGGVVAVGSFYGEATVSVGQPDAVVLPNAGEADGYVARFAPDGALSWVVHLAGPSHEFPTALAVLPDDSVMVTGLFRGDLTVGLGQAGAVVLPMYPYAHETGFVARISAEGVLSWAVRFGGTQYARADGAALDPLTEELVIGGTISGPGVAEFPADPPVYIDPVGYQGFVARFDPEGTSRAVVALGGFPESVDVAPDGTASVVGLFYGDAVFGAGEPGETTLSTPANSDVFAARFDGDNALMWAAQSTSPMNENAFGYGVAAMPDGTTLVVGGFTDRVGFDPGGANPTPLIAESPSDAFVAQFDPNGAFVCATHIAGRNELSTDVVARPDDTFVVAGSIGGRTRFALDLPEEIELTPSGDGDGYLATFGF